MTQGTNNGGMSMKKHGKCGSHNGNGKPPNVRLVERMAAEKNERKAKKSTCTFASVKDALE